jgi:hypothetical protein
MIEQKPEELPLADLVRLHLIGAVEHGFITIRYEKGRPTVVERHEVIRIGKPDNGAEPNTKLLTERSLSP